MQLNVICQKINYDILKECMVFHWSLKNTISKFDFIFFKNQKKIIKSLLNASRFIFLKNSLKKQDNKIIKYLKNNYFKMLIIDSYENTENFSKLIKQNSEIKIIKISNMTK